MSGTHNFQQWNPTAVNQDTDSQYTTDTLRVNGAANPSIMPSKTGNKLFFQVTTFIKAFADMLATKNYSTSDANAGTLASVLGNVMTQADMTPYAPLNSPALITPSTASTPAGGDASGRIPNTYWVASWFATMSWVQGIFAPLASPSLSGTPTAPTAANGDISTKIANTQFLANNYAPLSEFANVLNSSGGGQQLPSGLIIKWGSTGTMSSSGPTNVTFPSAFPHACFFVLCFTSDTGASYANAYAFATTGFTCNTWAGTTAGGYTIGQRMTGIDTRYIAFGY